MSIHVFLVSSEDNPFFASSKTATETADAKTIFGESDDSDLEDLGGGNLFEKIKLHV